MTKVPIQWQYVGYLFALILLASMSVGQFIYPASEVPRLPTPVLILGAVAMLLAVERLISLSKRMAVP